MKDTTRDSRNDKMRETYQFIERYIDRNGYSPRLNRRYVGCDLNAEYVEMARRRLDSIPYSLFSLAAD